MRLELDSKNDDDAQKAKENAAVVNSHENIHDEIKEQKEKFSELSFKKKIEYVYDYYKWFFIIGIAVIGGLVVFLRDYKDNMRPTYIEVAMINSYFGYDSTNTVQQDYINQYNIDTNEYKIYVDMGINLSEEAFDTTMLASQQKLVSMYAAKDLDVVIGPVAIMEGPANCDAYGDLSELLPDDLIEQLKDREYEFYYFDPTKDEIEDYEENRQPYFAGIYLDTCSYLNNNGEYGAYPVATDEDDRPIFTIPANTQRLDHAIEFLRFLIENR